MRKEEPLKGLRETREQLNIKEHIFKVEAEANIELRDRAVSFLFRAYGGLLFGTMIIFFLQGFKIWGFELSQTTLNWLGGATIGEIGGLAAMVYGSLFRRKN